MVLWSWALGKARAEEKVLWSWGPGVLWERLKALLGKARPLVLGKQERKKEARLLGTRFLGRARAEEKVLGSGVLGKAEEKGRVF